MKKTKLFINNRPLNTEVRVANNFFQKTIGLMFANDQSYGLLIPSCKSIHTFFMYYALNVVALDSGNTVLCIYRDVKPWKILLAKRKTKNILELPSDLINISKITVGSKLSFRGQ
ncbi:DUF192 domain-containing protein [Elusimicrobiota bacterium]